MSRKLPKYQRHSNRDQAYINYQRRRIYLGKFDSPESWENYHRLCAEIAAGHKPSLGAAGRRKTPVVTINTLMLAFKKFVQVRYVKNGKPTSEVRSYGTALRPVREMYGHTPADEFGPKALALCRSKLVQAGFTRNRVNGHVSRICRMFKWGVSQEMVAETTYRALMTLEGLLPGEAHDNPEIEPVDIKHVEAIEQFVTPQVWAIIQFQNFTACRPGEAVQVRGCDIRGDLYQPASHKTEHHGKSRLIPLGPRAKALLDEWNRPDATEYLWQPREARAWYFAKRRDESKNKPHKQRPRKKNALRRPSQVYTVGAYEKAIERACMRAGIPKWCPNQLRHLAATRIRSECDEDTARVVLGHSAPSVTQVYAKADLKKAVAAMRKLG